MTERTRLISYLLYGLFGVFVKRTWYNKNTRSNFQHPLGRAGGLSSSLILKTKYLYASFSFSFWKNSCTLSVFIVVFAHVLVAFTPAHLKEPPSIQSQRTYYCVHIIKLYNKKQENEWGNSKEHIIDLFPDLACIEYRDLEQTFQITSCW